MFEFIKIDETEYECCDKYKHVWFYRRKNPINSEKRDNGNRFVFKATSIRDDTYFGEVVGSEIAKATIGNACRASLAKKSTGYENKYENGVISYYYNSDNDSIITPSFLLDNYCKKRKIDIRNSKIPYFPTIETSIQAISEYMLYTLKRPVSELKKVKQQFIDMIIFDCKFGNYDRNKENWMLVRNGITGEVGLYPLFDNEAVLGFCEEVYSPFAPANMILDYCTKLPTKYNINYDSQTSSFEDVIQYMILQYPEETDISIKKVEAFSLYNLSYLLNQFPDMSDERKVFTKKMFLTRESLFKRAKSNAKHSIESSLDIEDEDRVV